LYGKFLGGDFQAFFSKPKQIEEFLGERGGQISQSPLLATRLELHNS